MSGRTSSFPVPRMFNLDNEFLHCAILGIFAPRTSLAKDRFVAIVDQPLAVTIANVVGTMLRKVGL